MEIYYLQLTEDVNLNVLSRLNKFTIHVQNNLFFQLALVETFIFYLNRCPVYDSGPFRINEVSVEFRNFIGGVFFYRRDVFSWFVRQNFPSVKKTSRRAVFLPTGRFFSKWSGVFFYRRPFIISWMSTLYQPGGSNSDTKLTSMIIDTL